MPKAKAKTAKKEIEVYPRDASDDEYLKRAVVAWYRSGRAQPWPANDSGTETFGGKDYVVLRNVNGVLAVYRIRNQGMLKRLKRWPQEIE
jgi:hypothetical protein